MGTQIGEPNAIAMIFFFAFIAITLGITYWAARRTHTTEQFYVAGRAVSAGQNGFALAGDYMSAASFLGIAGLVSTSGFDGLIYSTGWLVGWPVVLFLIAEPLRNLGRYTFADVVALRFRQTPVRLAAALGTLATVTFYLIAQMVGAGGLIRLLFGIPYETAVILVGVAMLAYVLFGGMLATTWASGERNGLRRTSASHGLVRCSRMSAAITVSNSPGTSPAAAKSTSSILPQITRSRRVAARAAAARPASMPVTLAPG